MSYFWRFADRFRAIKCWLIILPALSILLHSAGCRALHGQTKGFDKTPGLKVPAITSMQIPPKTEDTMTVTPAESQTPKPSESPLPPQAGMKITIVYDNNPYRTGLQSDWGFAAVVDYGEERLLFDTGKDGTILLSNMKKLDILPQSIDYLVLSHGHSDHTGGVGALLGEGARPTTYVLPSLYPSLLSQLRGKTEVVKSRSGQQIADRFYTTGELAGSPPEQALVLDTTKGLVVITGCAHPGIVQMVREAKIVFHEKPYLVMGGFHLGDKSAAQIEIIPKQFRKLGVVYVAPCHCSGAEARRIFAREYGEQYLDAGVGRVIDINP